MKKYLFFFLSFLCATHLYGQIVVEEKEVADTCLTGADMLINDTFDTDSLTPTSLPTDSLPWPLNVQARIDSLLQSSIFETSTVGLMVYDLTADSALFLHNHRQLLRPASTMKLLTAITAIDRLGGSYQLRTSLYYSGTIDNRTLCGDLICVGGMDPRFNSDDMRAFVESLQRMGIDTLRGRIVADCSMKDTLQWGEGWCWDDDNPTLSPLLIGKKANFTERLLKELTDQGIVLNGVVTTCGTRPADAKFICSRTHTIDQILGRMMKESDNLYAEAMFYQIAASTGNRPATAKHAHTMMQQLIRKLGLNPKGYRMADGSGLSLYNYLSAELLVRLLRYAWHNQQVYDLLQPSLPIAGEDGTLKKRMKSPFTSGNVRAKTGTVTGVSSLAGYCTAANGHELCFAIINQGIMHSNSGRHFQDRICMALCQP
ncbi:MAG: D-alanyl-D-alanine carboxypeptidase/D-alanyl-D-alanine-endopeptidase [Prevotella sp.]|nr:D-alanyl-D-alanine carboxypeptidase/D-alanyl-D-alanine-endopeptidase [Prevotella sp.]